jgi:hypothetical protein
VTGGVSFDKIITMMGEIGGGAGDRDPVANPFYEAKSELETVGPQSPGRNAAFGRAAGGSLKFQGLAALLAQYLRFGKKPNPPLNYAKLISNSILVRTDFGKIFKKLGDDERRPFETNPNTFANSVLTAAEMTGTEDTLVYERGIRKSYRRESKNYNKLVSMPIKRGEWLKTITTGVDKLSSHHVPKLKSQFEGLGALGPRTDRVGDDPAPAQGSKDKGSGIIMEFRNMRKNVLYSDFIPLARGIFNYIKQLNARDDQNEENSDEDF